MRFAGGDPLSHRFSHGYAEESAHDETRSRQNLYSVGRSDPERGHTAPETTMGIALSCSALSAYPAEVIGGPPAGPTPTPTTHQHHSDVLALSGPNTLRTGQSGNYTAVLSMSNGTTQNVTPEWTSDALSVLTINSSGQGNALTHGSATVRGSAQGVSSTTQVRVTRTTRGRGLALTACGDATSEGPSPVFAELRFETARSCRLN